MKAFRTSSRIAELFAVRVRASRQYGVDRNTLAKHANAITQEVAGDRHHAGGGRAVARTGELPQEAGIVRQARAA